METRLDTPSRQPTNGPWVLFQSWRKLLFAHWPVPVERLRGLVPEPLVLEEFDGRAWIGLTPFLLTGMRARFMPAVPGISEFPEMNLRTYVRFGGRAGIYFFSLDAGSRLAVAGARLGYGLPYFAADMDLRQDADGWTRYLSRRRDGDAVFAGRYRPAGPVFRAERGTLDHFLTERYSLFTVRGGKVVRGDIQHAPWPLQPAEAEIERNTVAAEHGIALPERPPLLHYSERQDTRIWPPRVVS